MSKRKKLKEFQIQNLKNLSEIENFLNAFLIIHEPYRFLGYWLFEKEYERVMRKFEKIEEKNALPNNLKDNIKIIKKLIRNKGDINE